MFDFIEGKIVKLTPAYAVINCNGIGFYINISVYTYEKLKINEPAKLNVHQVISEDSHILFGFYSEKEREVFRQLISVSGVGANTARVLLSSLSEDTIINAIIRKDAPLLQSVKGIGPKAAQRIILELHDKIAKTANVGDTLTSESGNAFDEALQALMALGFVRTNAEKALLNAGKELGNNVSTERLIKDAFKYL
ncbi:MAG: Holliday junction branch migration protein RuvA [Bacteroidetes bacterium]|nr:Holliday junction branch migration protein RuvA [Bacteroidota bacterium]